MIIKVILFRRDAKSEWEPGVSIESKKDSILDSQGNRMTEVYDIKDRAHTFCIDLETILDETEKFAKTIKVRR